MSQKRLRVLTLVPYPLGQAPGQRYRIEQWAPYLQEAGIELDFAPFATPALARLLYQPGHVFTKAVHMLRALGARVPTSLRAASYDAVYLYREASLLGPAWLERLAWQRNARILYDFDDAIWLHYVSPRNRHLSYLKAPGKTRGLCRMAAAVTVGSEHLAQYARRYNRNVTVVPSTVSLREYRPGPARPQASDPVIGWTGSHSSVQYLCLVKDALRALAQRRHFRFQVIGVDGLGIPGVRVECRPWNSRTEVEDLWPLDIGIMPLADDPWTAGKCAMKAIQYMGVGIPAVVSPVGANVEVVEHGVSGIHASTTDEWVCALERCLDDQGLRRRLGQAGRAAVVTRYSAEAQVPVVASLIRGLVQ